MSLDGVRSALDPFGNAQRMVEKRKFQLQQWPVKLHKIPVNAPFFHKAHLLVVSDCAALCHVEMHRYMTPGRVPLICCPQADPGTIEKLAGILTINDVRSITVLNMRSLCCYELEDMAKVALQRSRKRIPFQSISLLMPKSMEDN